MTKVVANIKFAQKEQAEFFSTLRQRVNDHFTKNQISQKGNWKLYTKSVVFIAAYLVPLALIIANVLSGWAIVVGYTIMGLGMVGIGMSIMHDAIHGSYSQSSWLNKLMGRSIDIVGGNVITWQIQHNVLHHTFTNIYGHDEDIHDKPILRLSPEGKLWKIHRFQHYYALFLYGLSTVSWATSKDFRQMIDYQKRGLLEKVGAKFTPAIIELTISKILYFIVVLALPLFFSAAPWSLILAGFFAMHFTAGVILTVVFQLAHVVENTEHPIPSDEGNMENTWAIHQLYTTANFAKNNKFLSWYVGGLNFQIEHHLFAHISHVHYPAIAPIVKQTALEFGIPYNEYKTLTQAIVSHWRVLRLLGRDEWK
jgi:linoleoyl-CoA desaturase